MLHLNFSPFPVLTTERLIMRQLTTNDTAEIMKLRSEEMVNEFIDRPKSINFDEAKKFIEKIEKGISENKWIYWVISTKDEGTLIGTICYWNIVPEKDMAETGYELHPQFQGKGIMHEAFRKVLFFGLRNLKLKIITALTHPANESSIRLLEKNDFLLDKNNCYVSEEDAGGQSVYYLHKAF